jgi:ABC-type sugar transport system ATPase subunit
MSNTSFLQMRNISKQYQGTLALQGVTFSAWSGEVHAVSGENGAGKSTLIKILAGAVQPDEGEIYLNNERVIIRSPYEAHSQGIYTVYQEFSLVQHLSIAENILLGQMPTRRLKGWVNWSTAYAQAASLLGEIGFSGFDVRMPVSQLSVSQQQIVEIAKALAGRPRILILDEPTAVLSQGEVGHLFRLIKALKAQSILVLYISHRLDELFEIADRITVLKDGQLVSTVNTADTDNDHLIRLMVGRTLKEIYPKQTPKQAGEVLRVQGLSREETLKNISFTLARGEILGLFGLVGSGRTELARCLFGADPITTGEIYLDGQPIHPKTPRQAVQSGIAFLTEDRKRSGLVLGASIKDNISLASMSAMNTLGFLHRREQEKRVKAKVQELNIRTEHIYQHVWQLSGGNQQKVALAKWLLVNAKVLILDEPTRGIDVGTKVEIYQFIHQLAAGGLGVLLISSEMLEIIGLCSRALVMREGQLVGELTQAQFSEENLLTLAAGVTPKSEVIYAN